MPVCLLDLPYKFYLFHIAPVLIFYCPLGGLFELLDHSLLPPALPCMPFSYGFAFPENTLLLHPPPPLKFQISLPGSQHCTPYTSRWVCSVTTGSDSPPAS